MWDSWTCEIGSREARGEAFYTALFDAAPSLQLMFKSPKAVTASCMQIVDAIEQQITEFAMMHSRSIIWVINSNFLFIIVIYSYLICI